MSGSKKESITNPNEEYTLNYLTESIDYLIATGVSIAILNTLQSIQEDRAVIIWFFSSLSCITLDTYIK